MGQPPSPASLRREVLVLARDLDGLLSQCRALLACCQGADLCNVVPVMRRPVLRRFQRPTAILGYGLPWPRHASGPVNEPCDTVRRTNNLRAGDVPLTGRRGQACQLCPALARRRARYDILPPVLREA